MSHNLPVWLNTWLTDWLTDCPHNDLSTEWQEECLSACLTCWRPTCMTDALPDLYPTELAYLPPWHIKLSVNLVDRSYFFKTTPFLNQKTKTEATQWLYEKDSDFNLRVRKFVENWWKKKSHTPTSGIYICGKFIHIKITCSLGWQVELQAQILWISKTKTLINDS